MSRAFLVLAILLATVAACSSGRDDNDSGDGTRLSEGQTLGRIERLPGGTPVATEVRTLLAAECEADHLTVRTNVEEISGPMPCDRMLPAAVIERFIAKPVVLAYRGERLHIESATEGTMELPVSEPRLRSTNAP